MKIEQNMAVFIDYVLKNKQGDVLDSSTEEQPLGYIHGGGTLIPGLETALGGCKTGDVFSVEIKPKDAYGDYNDELLRVAPKEDFEELETLEPGVQFEVEVGKGSDTQRHMAQIKEVNDKSVTFDMNHPLAGEILCFDIKVKDIRVATPDELEHGHIHGPGGVEH